VKRYEIKTEIEAAPDRVWHVLTREMPEAPAPYGIIRLDGGIAPGATLKLWSEVSPNRAFALRVVAYDPPNTMVWKGGLPFGLFTGTRTFAITERANGCLFELHEVFSGPMSGLITKSMPDLGPGFSKFAQALKKEAEQI